MGAVSVRPPNVRLVGIDQDHALMQRVVAGLLGDLRPDGPGAPDAFEQVSLESDLESDLGLDSLDRVELLARVEEAFEVRLPDQVLEQATTPAAVLAAVLQRRGDTGDPGNADHDGKPRGPSPSKRAAAIRPGGGESGGRASEVSPSKPALGEVTTLVGALEWHARAHPNRRHLRLCYLDGTSPDPEPDDMTYGDLHAGSLTVASRLRSLGLAPGERVAIMLPTVRAFFPLFAGILAAGGVVVPIYPPSRPDRIEEHLMRQAGILDNAGVSMMVTTGQGRTLGPLLRLHVPTLRKTIDVDDLVPVRREPGAVRPETGAGLNPEVVGSGDLAMLQYTSGSTGSPKGVMMTHGQLLANLHAMDSGAGPVPEDQFVSWLPLYHDMGLIGAWMAAMYLGFGSVIMSPLAFLSQPKRWLTTISEEGGTISAAPNFAFDLCVQRIKDDDLRGVDLSSWRIVMSGAEPVRAATIDRFQERFEKYGLRPEALAPVYGMAEVGLGLTFTPPGRGPLVDRVDRQELAASGRAVPLLPDIHGPERRVVSCGRPLPGFEVRIVGTGRDAGALPERTEGRVECRGPSTTGGYFHNSRATAELYHDGWLDTGDLGYLAAGELYLTGRSKDLVIKAGRNIHPEEIEAAVSAVPDIRSGCVAAFAVTGPGATGPDADSGTEQLVVVAETRMTNATGLASLRRAVAAAVVDAIGSPPDQVLLAPPGSVLKTSSGKIRRNDTRASYEAGRIIEGHRQPSRSVPAQIVSVAVHGLRLRACRVGRRAHELAWGVQAWATVVAIGVPTWLTVLVTPGRQRRWRILQRAGTLLCSALRIHLEVRQVVDDSEGDGEEKTVVPGSGAGGSGLSETGAGGSGLSGPPELSGPAGRRGSVVVANHASFVDSLAVILALPGPLTFTGGEVLETQRVAGPFLRRLGVVFVGGGDARRASDVVATLTGAVRAGSTVVFFPEGGLAAKPGIRRFHRGAFLVAVDAGVPVVPVAIRGTREVVGPGHRFPNHGNVEVMIGPALLPAGCGAGPVSTGSGVRDGVRHDVRHGVGGGTGNGDGPGGGHGRWATAIDLEGRARRWILDHAGEPDAVSDHPGDPGKLQGGLQPNLR